MCHKEIKITTHDRLLMSWEKSMEMVRDFQMYADEVKDDNKVKQAFYDMAENSCQQASQLRDLLLKQSN